jgi:poly-beta-hydroxybutyrate-responsive repressor
MHAMQARAVEHTIRRGLCTQHDGWANHTENRCREWNSYGYELMGRARMFGFEAMNTGTLYLTLRRMKKDGVVESIWETSGGGPARRMYTITGSGNAHLRIWVKSLERYQQSVDDFFKLYGGKPPHADENEDD